MSSDPNFLFYAIIIKLQIIYTIFCIYCSLTDFPQRPPYKPEQQLPSSHGPQFLALGAPLPPDSPKYFLSSVSSPSPPVLIPSHGKLPTALSSMYNLESFHCFIPLQLVIQVMAPEILGSSFEHSRKISQFLTCSSFWLVFILAVQIAVLELISDTDSKFQILFSEVPKGGVR